MPFDDYFKIYTDSLREISKETFDKFPEESEMLFEFIDNWIDLFPKDDERFAEAANSLSGIILIDSWKLSNWVSYEILCGKYFEAIRNLRFLFEGCVFAVIIEDVIESRVFEKWGNLADLFLKEEIFRLWEECKKNRVYQRSRINQEVLSKLVADFVNQHMDSLRKDEIPEYIELYTKTLSDERLSLQTSKMIEHCKTFLKIDENDAAELKKTWHELSGYTHFSHKYLDAIAQDVEFLFVEKVNDRLFNSSITLYFQTLDLLYSVLAWRFTSAHDEIKKMCGWWKDNFNKTFILTEKVLENA